MSGHKVSLHDRKTGVTNSPHFVFSFLFFIFFLPFFSFQFPDLPLLFLPTSLICCVGFDSKIPSLNFSFGFNSFALIHNLFLVNSLLIGSWTLSFGWSNCFPHKLLSLLRGILWAQLILAHTSFDSHFVTGTIFGLLMSLDFYFVFYHLFWYWWSGLRIFPGHKFWR